MPLKEKQRRTLLNIDRKDEDDAEDDGVPDAEAGPGEAGGCQVPRCGVHLARCMGGLGCVFVLLASVEAGRSAGRHPQVDRPT